MIKDVIKIMTYQPCLNLLGDNVGRTVQSYTKSNGQVTILITLKIVLNCLKLDEEARHINRVIF